MGTIFRFINYRIICFNNDVSLCIITLFTDRRSRSTGNMTFRASQSDPAITTTTKGEYMDIYAIVQINEYSPN